MFHFDRFPGQEPDEKIIMVLHRHWFVFVGQAIRILLLAIFPAIAFIIWSYVNGWEGKSTDLSFVLVIMGAGLYYLFLWMLFFGFWLDYYLDFFIISDRRVVDIEQSGLFDRSIAELRLYRIQDVTSEIKGFVPTLLRFGNVYIQTAGTEERFVFEQVPHPDEVVKKLLAMTDKIDDSAEHAKETQQTPVAARHPQQR